MQKHIRRQQARNYALVQDQSKTQQSVQRTASGRKSRSKAAIAAEANQTMSTALEARARHNDCSKDEARDPIYGSAFGRKFKNGDLGTGKEARQRYNAGVEYALNYTKHRAALGFPALTAQALEFGRVRGRQEIEDSDQQATKEQEARLWLNQHDRLFWGLATDPNQMLMECLLKDDPATERWPVSRDEKLCEALDLLKPQKRGSFGKKENEREGRVSHCDQREK